MQLPKLIDTHAHLDQDIYAHDLEIVVKHALEDGIWIVTIGTDYETSKRAVELAERFPEGVYAAVGIHPRKVGENLLAEDKLLQFEKFSELAAHPKVVAIGETGLDFHDLPRDPRTDPNLQAAERIRANQKKVLGAFLELARQHRLPLSLHCREAHGEMLQMLDNWGKTSPGYDAKGVVHCFSGSWKEAKRYFNLGFAVSLTGIITHGAYQTELIKKAPASQLMIESDCPYLTPVPWSIRRNEPAYLSAVADSLAGIRGIPAAQAYKETTMTALRMFTRIPR